MASAKEKQYTRANLIFTLYLQTLQVDVNNVIMPKQVPPPLDFYSLRQTTEVAPGG